MAYNNFDKLKIKGCNLDFSPSRLLGNYIKDVEETTQRKVMISPYPDATPEDEIWASLEIGPDISDVEIHYWPLRPITDPSVEKSIAHELTHAYQIYYLGFPIACAPPEVPQQCYQTVFEIIDFIDDIIVDVTIQKLGFPPITHLDLIPYKNNLKLMEMAKPQDKIDTGIKDPIRAEIKLVSDYLYAWALPKYAQLSPDVKELFLKYTKRFPQVLKVEYKKAKIIKKLILANDIFTIEGRTTVIKGSISLWPIDHRFYFASISKHAHSNNEAI